MEGKDWTRDIPPNTAYKKIIEWVERNVTEKPMYPTTRDVARELGITGQSVSHVFSRAESYLKDYEVTVWSSPRSTPVRWKLRKK